MKDSLKKNSVINVHLVGDKEIRELNKKYLKRDYPTDVLSFNMDENLPDGSYYLGDVIVNIDQARRQMNEYENEDIRLEIAELIEHGSLHLMGIHHDEKDKKKHLHKRKHNCKRICS